MAEHFTEAAVRKSIEADLALIEHYDRELPRLERYIEFGVNSAHLKWAFSEAAVGFLRANKPAQALRQRLMAKHGKGKSLAIIAAKLARAVYFMLKRGEAFDAERFFAH